MYLNNENYLNELFIEEAKGAIGKHAGITEIEAQLDVLEAEVANALATKAEQSARIEELETWKEDNDFAVTVFESRKNSHWWSNMFAYCDLVEPLFFDTSHVTDMGKMFFYCKSLVAVPLYDTSKVVSFDNMFNSCIKLKEVPLFDTSSLVSMVYMFVSCKSLESIPAFDTSNVTQMYGAFQSCPLVTTVPLLDTSKVKSAVDLFKHCESLKSVPRLNIRSCTSTTNMFTNCVKLTDCYLCNIKTPLQVGSGTTYGHLLTLDSLKHLIYELRDTGSMKTLTVGSANLEKLADVYVKTVDITDEMRAEDDLIDEKLPYEVCDSTDENAILITNYVKLKNWQIG